MNLQECLTVLTQQAQFEAIAEKEEDKLLYSFEGRICKFFQRNNLIYWECSFGSKLEDTIQNNQKLSELLQFNLKRMSFLDEILHFDPKTQHLYLQKQIPTNTLLPENLTTLWEDFLMNVETIEDRIFPKDNL